ncbi:hypothetical protein C8Q78DRAFT_1077520 [Trametes maxima]|nr:hypothetical protein C8Q78DRAFT_1077520 [Trametes maxima]
MRTRYSNKTLQDALGISDDRLEDSIMNIVNPRIGRPTSKGLEKPVGKGHKKAGYADFIGFDEIGAHPTFGVEVKCHWQKSYENEVMEGLRTSATVDALTGQFRWNDKNSRGATFLQQIWGEMEFAKLTWALITNGSRVFFVVKTGPQELTLSDLMSITDPDLYQTALGMCFASVDQKIRPGGLPGYLCAGSTTVTGV